MNCDRIAPFYWLLERIAFGGSLQRHRLAFLSAARGQQRVLILGDGDGRFTQALMNAYPDAEIDSIELSAGMAAQARQRRVPLIQADAFLFSFREDSYDILFTHFFLDCFTTQEVNALIARVAASLTRRAIWIISDFRQAPAGWRKVYTQAWLGSMYLFFRYMTDLKTSSLPTYEPALRRAGFNKRAEKVSRFGLIASEWWQR